MDPAQNAEYAARMMRGLIDRNGGDVSAALHDYNAGSAARQSTTTRWGDGATLSYEDSVLRHQTELRAHLAVEGHAIAPATPAPPVVEPKPAAEHRPAAEHLPIRTDYTRPDADRILGETRHGSLVESKAELEAKNALLARAERDARSGRIDEVRFVGDGRESAREVARQNEKLWRGIENNLPADGRPPIPPERRDGYTQSGKIVSVADGIVTQDIGRGQTAQYAAQDFHTPPNAGDTYTVSYRDGIATATEHRETQQQVLGR